MASSLWRPILIVCVCCLVLCNGKIANHTCAVLIVTTRNLFLLPKLSATYAKLTLIMSTPRVYPPLRIHPPSHVYTISTSTHTHTGTSTATTIRTSTATKFFFQCRKYRYYHKHACCRTHITSASIPSVSPLRLTVILLLITLNNPILPKILTLIGVILSIAPTV